MTEARIKDYIVNRYGSGLNLLGQPKPFVNTGSESGVILPEYSSYQESEPYAFAISSNKKSYLGTLVWSDMLLELDGIEVYFDTVLFNVNQTKNIVKTALQGRNGTIKEYISDGDYVIDIKAALVSQDREYPEDAVRNLVAMLQLPFAIEVTSPLLQLFGVYSLVVEDYSFPTQAGFTNTQLVEMNCVSDSPIELIQDDTTNQ